MVAHTRRYPPHIKGGTVCKFRCSACVHHVFYRAPFSGITGSTDMLTLTFRDSNAALYTLSCCSREVRRSHYEVAHSQICNLSQNVLVWRLLYRDIPSLCDRLRTDADGERQPHPTHPGVFVVGVWEGRGSEAGGRCEHNVKRSIVI